MSFPSLLPPKPPSAVSATKSNKLEDQAATAALRDTKGKDDKSDKSSNYPLDADGKLSSASAATSLKHAQPQELPGFPIVGLPNTDSSAGAAASLANAHPKSVEYWKPGNIPEANKAAYTAKDYKSEPVWQPDLGPAGSKAALQAHREGGEVKVWRPSETDAGHSAAGQAMRKKRLAPQVFRGPTVDEEKKALMAAMGAVTGSRKRSDSTPTPANSYPDASNSAANALKAATSVNRLSRESPTPGPPKQAQINAGKIHNRAVTNLSREMYTSHPPVAPEVDEQKKQDTLRAAAVSMAKQMYDVQQKRLQEASAVRRSDSQYAASVVGDRPQCSASSAVSTGPPRYANLEEAAKKLAAERLAKLHDEHDAYRTYYGTEKTPSKRLSIRGRRRASSEGENGDSDRERSSQIRKQMSFFNDSVTQIDKKKQKQDRESLMAAAQRNVRASMTAQDARVFNETGKVSPAMMAEWEARAKAKAESESQARMANHGMVSIGGGKFLDQSEVEAIAAVKVQPTLDDIAETAERQRARDEELRQQQLERDRISAEKAADDKERAARTKEEWQKFREDEKREDRARKEEAKARKAEDKKHRDEEKRRTALGKMKVIFHKDDADEGNEAALDKLEGQNGSAVTATPTAKAAESSAPVVPETSPTADEIAKRVFAAPVVAGEDNSTEEIVVKAKSPEDTEPSTSTQPPAASGLEAQLSQPAKPAVLPVESPSVSCEKAAPLADRIVAPPATVQPTTETTDTSSASPGSGTKEKDGSKVSSWLKSKLGRRSSKATPATSSDTRPTISAPKDPKVFVGAANLGAPDTFTTDSSDPAGGESSMHEVAMAGKEAWPVDASVVSPASEPKDRDVHPTALAPGALFAAQRKDDSNGGDDSTSISSLSSDEDTRGRSSMRLADQIQQSGPAATTAGESTTDSKDFAAASATGHGRGTSEPKKEEYEDARDSFSNERLEPPKKGVLGSSVGVGRKSDSPAKDSKFVEDL